MLVRCATIRATDGKIIVASAWRTTRYDAATVERVEVRVGLVNTWRRSYPVVHVNGRDRKITTCNFAPTGERAEKLRRAVEQLNDYIACVKAGADQVGSRQVH